MACSGWRSDRTATGDESGVRPLADEKRQSKMPGCTVQFGSHITPYVLITQAVRVI